jgi:hypothetical protein
MDPTTIEILVDVGHRTLQVVDVFRVPAPKKSVVNGDADTRVCLGSFRQREAIFSSNLAHDGNPVAGRWPVAPPGSPIAAGQEAQTFLWECFLFPLSTLAAVWSLIDAPLFSISWCRSWKWGSGLSVATTELFDRLTTL